MYMHLLCPVPNFGVLHSNFNPPQGRAELTSASPEQVADINISLPVTASLCQILRREACGQREQIAKVFPVSVFLGSDLGDLASISSNAAETPHRSR